MEQQYDRVEDCVMILGVILCKYCYHMIDTVDTDGVRIFYGECEQDECIKKRESGGEVYEC